MEIIDVVVEVVAAGEIPEPVTTPVEIDAALALLGTADLAGAVFGAEVEATILELGQLFGPPIADTGWEAECVLERRVSWAGLDTWFWGDWANPHTPRDSDIINGRFVSYRYHGPTAIGNLTTTSGVRLGLGVHELRALVPTSVFSTGYDSYPTDLWWADRQDDNWALAGELNSDATDPEAILTSIVSGSESHPFSVC